MNIQNQKSIAVSGTKLFWTNKRLFDLTTSIFLLPILVVIYFIILCINFLNNSKEIFFIQKRMGKDCKPFNAIKFRTMTPTNISTREYNDPIEHNRITPLGKFLRKFRIDELPQIINVIKGDMSLIGPRPDYHKHAEIFLTNIEGYRERHRIRPGISGLSQIRLGYAEGLEATAKKSHIDNYYIANMGYILEFKIVYHTIITIFKGLGS